MKSKRWIIFLVSHVKPVFVPSTGNGVDALTNVAHPNAQGAALLGLTPVQSHNIKSVRHNWFPARLEHKAAGRRCSLLTTIWDVAPQQDLMNY